MILAAALAATLVATALVAHVAPVGQICRSLVEISTPTRGYGATARVIRHNVCMPFTDLQP
jgi:hypothetical protein